MSWTLIEHQALSSSVASVTLGNGGTIPQGYKTIKVVVSERAINTGGVWDNLFMKINNSSTSYSGRTLSGNGATASSTVAGTNVIDGAGTTASTTANTFSSVEYTLSNYSSANNKTVSIDGVTENNGTTAIQFLYAYLWSDSTAVTSLVFTVGSSSSFAAGSTFTVYGLK